MLESIGRVGKTCFDGVTARLRPLSMCNRLDKLRAISLSCPRTVVVAESRFTDKNVMLLATPTTTRQTFNTDKAWNCQLSRLLVPNLPVTQPAKLQDAKIAT
jgi:hypothetical protein